MELLTQALRKEFESHPLYSTEKNKDARSVCKFFTPTSSFTWHVFEFDGQDTFFGFVTSSLCPEGEWGYFSLEELQSVKGPLGLGVERDLYYTPIKKGDL